MTESPPRINDGAAERGAAALAIGLVTGDGRTIDVALADPRVRRLATVSPPAVQALVYGALRFGLRLKAAVEPLLAKPWDEQSPELRGLLLLGLYQLEHAGLPPHAAVSTVVDAARLIGKAKSAGFVNAILRRFQRQREELLATVDESRALSLAHPPWFAKALARDWGDEVTAAVLAANNLAPPLWLRANRRRGSRDALAASLAAEGCTSRPVAFAPDALRLDSPVDVRTLGAFLDGRCSVQDAAAQLATGFLQAAPGHRVLDACAAPGGKTGHLLETLPELGAVVAVEFDAARAARITANLDRLGLSAPVHVADATEPDTWWDGVPFQRILLDVPCSGTGVIRRHPDIKWLRRAADLRSLAKRQRRLLDALWPLLAPGGRLLYVSCSVLRAENADVISEFLESTPDALDVTEAVGRTLPGLPPASGPGPGYALLPGIADTDGFYYACLDKRAADFSAHST